MIILQTGVPGSGKTSSIIALLMDDESYTHFIDKDGERKKRPLFVNGIRELKLEHTELSDEQIKNQPLQDFLPYGSLVIIDEAQRLMGTRAAASKVPAFIEALATHRHHGLDIVLITQHPSFLDPFVRKLVQRHMHISIKAVGRKLYEWNECVDQPDAPPNIARAIERQFSLSKKAFEMYHSAEVHTKPKRRIPKSLIFLILFLPLLIGFAIKTYLSMAERYGSENQTTAEVTEQSASEPIGQNYATQPVNEPNNSLTPTLFVPTLAERPESKPIYDTVRQVKQYERIAACIIGGKSGCTCYSDQATPLKEVTQAMCQDYAENGLPFDPFRDKPTITETQQTESTNPEPSQVLALTGAAKPNLQIDPSQGPSAQ